MTQKKWGELGMLDGLLNNRKKNVAKALTITYEYISNMPSTDDQCKTLIFPIIRRIVEKFDLTKEEIIEIIKEFRESLKNFNSTNIFQTDAEVEFVSLFSDLKINSLEIKNIENAD